MTNLINRIYENEAIKQAKEVSIADAIDGSIDDRLNDGHLERVSGKADNAAKMLGQLVQMLHENGCLRDEQVASMLGYRYTVWD